MTLNCPVCDLHHDIDQWNKYEIDRDDPSVLRHHPAPAPAPAPQVGWLLLDSLRHCSCPIDSYTNEATIGDQLSRMLLLW